MSAKKSAAVDKGVAESNDKPKAIRFELGVMKLELVSMMRGHDSCKSSCERAWQKPQILKSFTTKLERMKQAIAAAGLTAALR